ncbi:MAG: glycerophosphodiester phosphodiesterase, partial [Chloroflexota bacterium]
PPLPACGERGTGGEGNTMIKVIGHRGAAGHAPENTVASFDRGLALGVDGVETDIRATRDGVLVLLHDATVDRTTDGTGAVADLTWEEVSRLNAAAHFGGGTHPFGQQRVPRLDDFLDRYGGRTTFRLELKARGVESAALRAVRARRLLDAAVFTSFQPDVIKAIRRATPDAQTAYLSGAKVFDQDVIQTALDAGANEVAPRADLIEPAMLARARAAGLRVWAWGVKDRDTLRQAVAAGIGGCTLDYPDWAAALSPA